ncbi:MAG: hypothetical protein IKK48_03940 [Firmicutes bacterium]|nr:hypothetical protein [Bacillota bacterium]
MNMKALWMVVAVLIVIDLMARNTKEEGQKNIVRNWIVLIPLVFLALLIFFIRTQG